MAVYKTTQVVFIITTLVGLITPIAVDPGQPCPAPPPCTCRIPGSMIDCSGKGLSHVPGISNGGQQRWTVDISYNQLTTIPKRAFENITVVSLNMSHNKISTLSMDCLVGSNDVVTSVHMESNQFWYLPNAIDDLTNLEILTMQDNPFIILGTSMSFASTLRYLTIGSENSPWPKYIDQLNAITHLTVVGLTCYSLPFDAFFNMAGTMKSLVLQNNECNDMPDSVQVLTNLEHLAVIDNHLLTSFDIHNLTSLTSLVIENSSLSTMPNISKCTHLLSIYVTDSPIKSWELDTIPPESKLRNITLDRTDFDHIPTALRQIPLVENLLMKNTNVSNIEDSDLSTLFLLRNLDLSNASLEGIAVTAFKQNTMLYSISLDNTNLAGVPRAIGEVDSLYVLNMLGDSIECTCKELGWMRLWGALEHFVTGSGTCQNTGMDLMTYIREYVPKCAT
ncbi:leucine-rich repeat-containing G-protein coupled receptor 4-like [Mizuhopecten yessoensis]|uniref:Leucine-rich repeat-containing G-protein coupled receptor 4 n=1 Tax=Mizuhopecten yessoensis TaxID=6573 RepID=A0A210PZ79_MIZYE|nr:leucine-rich repeat-containing G-protein coupled receptor 4-like [Mizuhopecten yessoensis]OWF41784.1 Leucine-rich repeat-containing G-protein coupled receptor 4 [Mizuhopecten yessoensis]